MIENERSQNKSEDGGCSPEGGTLYFQVAPSDFYLVSSGLDVTLWKTLLRALYRDGVMSKKSSFAHTVAHQCQTAVCTGTSDTWR